MTPKEVWVWSVRSRGPALHSQPGSFAHPQPVSVTHLYEAKAFSRSPSHSYDKKATPSRENCRKIFLTIYLFLDLPHSLAKLIKLKHLRSTSHLHCRAFLLWTNGRTLQWYDLHFASQDNCSQSLVSRNLARLAQTCSSTLTLPPVTHSTNPQGKITTTGTALTAS